MSVGILASLFPRFPEGGGGHVLPVGLQPVSNSSTETSRARGNRVAEGRWGGRGRRIDA